MLYSHLALITTYLATHALHTIKYGDVFWTFELWQDISKNHQEILFKVNVSVYLTQKYQANCWRDDPGSHGFNLYFFIWISVQPILS